MMKRLILVPVLLCMAGAFLSAQGGDRYEPNNSATGAYALSGLPVRLTDLNLGSNDEDWFRFTVTQPQMLRIVTEGNTDTVMTIYGPNSATEVFAENDDFSGSDGYNAGVRTNFSSPGIYYIKITGYSGETGSYTLSVSPLVLTTDPNEPNNSRSQAKSLDINSLPRTFSLSPGGNGGDQDWYLLRFSSFQYQENEGIAIYTTGDCDTYMELYQGDELIAENDDGADGYNARVSFVPQRQRSGNYYLMVRGYSEEESGDYDLNAAIIRVVMDRHEPNNTRSQATSLSIGQTITGNTLSEGDSEDWFTFSVTRKGNFIIGTEGEVDTNIELFGSDEYSIKSDDDSGDNYNALLIANLDPGTYFIKVTHYSGDDLEYSLFVRQ
ncbi:MAG: pre-peptidase C-terminal domain-containing protein [Spirochaetaceae bacterium]|jgi:hypothetical protein|nr:pre-peptidase C-terminal domain-containing protein [Spirochaetaceae bacterium]